MRACLYESTGDADDVLRLAEVDRPDPGPGEVRVKVERSGVNPTDWKSRAGATPRPIDGFQIPHQDGAGTIDAVGEGVDRARVGQRVWVWFAAAGRRWGTAAEWTVVPEHQAVPMPEGTSFDLGASLGVPAMTAHYCLFADGSLAGATVLVAGGAGAVGHFAIELAKRAGATVATTVSGPEKAELARAAGADLVVDYKREDARARILDGVGRVDRIVEVNLGANLGLDTEVAAQGATASCYAATGDDPTLPVRACMNAGLVLRFLLLYNVPVEALQRAATDITAALEDGALTPLPSEVYPLAETAAAQKAVEGGFTGKVLVAPQETGGSAH